MIRGNRRKSNYFKGPLLELFSKPVPWRSFFQSRDHWSALRSMIKRRHQCDHYPTLRLSVHRPNLLQPQAKCRLSETSRRSPSYRVLLTAVRSRSAASSSRKIQRTLSPRVQTGRLSPTDRSYLLGHHCLFPNSQRRSDATTNGPAGIRCLVEGETAPHLKAKVIPLPI